MSQGLEVRVEHRQIFAYVQLTGFFGQLEVYRLKNQMEGLIEAGHKYILLDLAHVNYMDSAGIGSIVQMRRSCMQAAGNLFLIDAKTPQVRQAMATAALPMIIPTFNTFDEASQSMARQHGLSWKSEDQTAAEAEAAKSSSASPASLEKLEMLMTRLLERNERIEQRIEHLEKRFDAIEDPSVDPNNSQTQP